MILTQLLKLLHICGATTHLVNEMNKSGGIPVTVTVGALSLRIIMDVELVS